MSLKPSQTKNNSQHSKYIQIPSVKPKHGKSCQIGHFGRTPSWQSPAWPKDARLQNYGAWRAILHRRLATLCRFLHSKSGICFHDESCCHSFLIVLLLLSLVMTGQNEILLCWFMMVCYETTWWNVITVWFGNVWHGLAQYNAWVKSKRYWTYTEHLLLVNDWIQSIVIISLTMTMILYLYFIQYSACIICQKRFQCLSLIQWDKRIGFPS